MTTRKQAAASPQGFPNPAAFRSWLRQHGRSVDSLVVRIAKNHAADQGITYAQALDEALCYGWIDGVRRSLDANSYSVRGAFEARDEARTGVYSFEQRSLSLAPAYRKEIRADVPNDAVSAS